MTPTSILTYTGKILDLAEDPYRNAAAAYRLYRQRGWQPWVCA